MNPYPHPTTAPATRKPCPGPAHPSLITSISTPAPPEKLNHGSHHISLTDPSFHTSHLGAVARRVEHVGSTAVPGLAAKPIVDILIAVDDPDDEHGYLDSMEGAGYELRVREPGHRMFRTPERDVHIHVWKAGSEDERRHLLFRDWLRQTPDDRALYVSVKRRFVAERFTDMNYYARAKGPVIEEIMRRAEAWAAQADAQVT